MGHASKLLLNSNKAQIVNSTKPMLGRAFIIALVIVLLALSMPSQASLTSHSEHLGWQQTRAPKLAQQNIEVHSKRFSGDKVFLRTMPWEPLASSNLTRWIKKQWKQPYGPVSFSKKLSKNPQPQHRSDVFGPFEFAFVTRSVKKGGMLYASMLAACAREGSVRLTHVYGSSKSFKHPSMQSESEQLILKACETDPSTIKTTVSNAPSKSSDQTTAPHKVLLKKRPSFHQQQLPAGFKALWYIGYQVVGVYGFEPRQKAVMLFKDGTVTDDINTVFAKGVTASKQRNPKRWGEWQLDNSALKIKWHKRKSFKKMFASLKADPGVKDKRINQCFSSQRGYSIGFGATATHSMSVKKWCFGKNGRFSTSKAVAISGGGSGGPQSAGYAGSDKEGYYRIDGHIIQLAFDNGHTLVTSFGMLDENRQDLATDLLLGAGHYSD